MTDAQSSPAAVPAAFDDRGVPLTVAAAQSMTMVAVSDAMTSALARLKHKSVATYRAAAANGGDGTPRLDSQEVVWLIAEMSIAFGKPIIDLSKITDRASWSTLGALSNLVKGSLQ